MISCFEMIFFILFPKSIENVNQNIIYILHFDFRTAFMKSLALHTEVHSFLQTILQLNHMFPLILFQRRRTHV